eukprot:CAMPEP_0196154324 /NCGR_PEP_ID=MMETSP0910-20130528/38679_1 /TAXON_ID=49265 /ORGANISM="Thalassiosira rotula, Strain GSO102" /LENGTH=51 /DNA_ID=CAMNT_0041418309 /DNA_START=63 /DNA_END=215 /DNA_ORIENTATION=-
MSRKWYASSPSILLLLLAPFQRLAFADVTRGTVIIKRGADANSITSTFLDD